MSLMVKDAPPGNSGGIRIQNTKRYRKADRRMAWILVAPVLVVIVAVNLAPMLYSIGLSFFRWNLAQAYIPPKFVGLGNFVRLFTADAQFVGALLNTFLLMFGVVTIQAILGMAIAILLNQKLVGTRVITALLLIPMSISPTIVGFLFQVLFNDSLGPINFLIRRIGLKAPLWISSSSTALMSVGLVDIWQWTPFLVVLFLAGLRSLPIEPFEAATVDGASNWQKFYYLTLPLLKQVIGISIILRMMDIFKMFDLVYLLTFGGPGTSSQTLSFYGFRIGIHLFQVGYAASISFVMVQIFIFLIVIYFRLIRD